MLKVDSQRYSGLKKGSAFAQEPWLGIISFWIIWPSTKNAPYGVRLCKNSDSNYKMNLT